MAWKKTSDENQRQVNLGFQPNATKTLLRMNGSRREDKIHGCGG
jgi:hypothetical protein